MYKQYSYQYMYITKKKRMYFYVTKGTRTGSRLKKNSTRGEATVTFRTFFSVILITFDHRRGS
jgi:hypothetical protein